MIKLICLFSLASFCFSQQISVPLQSLQCDGGPPPSTAIRGLTGKRGDRGEKGEPCYSVDEYETRNRKFNKKLKSLRQQLKATEEENVELISELNETRSDLSDKIKILRNNLNETVTTLQQYYDEAATLEKNLDETQTKLSTAAEVLAEAEDFKSELKEKLTNNNITFHLSQPLPPVEENGCLLYPCGRGATCIETNISPFYSCQCNLPYYGDSCEKQYCRDFNPCYNNGICATTVSGPGYICRCIVGQGDFCETISGSSRVGRHGYSEKTIHIKFANRLSSVPTVDAWTTGSGRDYYLETEVMNVGTKGFTAIITKINNPYIYGYGGNRGWDEDPTLHWSSTERLPDKNEFP